MHLPGCLMSAHGYLEISLTNPRADGLGLVLFHLMSYSSLRSLPRDISGSDVRHLGDPRNHLCV